MSKGEVVTVKLYGGKTAERRVVSDKESFIVICSEGEFREAESEGREPQGVGFPVADVVLDEEVRL